MLTRSPATMPWFVAPTVTAASPVSTPARAWIVGPRTLDRIDQVESGPDGTFGVVLAGGRGTPHRHHRVADELLDDPAVAADHVRGELEVAGQGVANLFRVALLGERREPDEIGEQDGDEPALGEGGLERGWSGRSPGRRGRARAAPVAPPWLAPSGVPHSPQKTSPGSKAAPQLGQAVASGVAQATQNFRPGLFSVAQFGQITARSVDHLVLARGCRSQ